MEYLTEILDEDKELLKNGVSIIKSTIKILDDNISLTQDNSIKSWKLTTERSTPKDGFIGQFVARELTGEFQNISEDFNIENKNIQLTMGVERYGGERTNWYSLGTFIVEDPDDDEVVDNTKYTAYDLTVKFNSKFNAQYTSINYPDSFETLLKNEGYATTQWLANYVCEQAGVELATQDFYHNDFRVLSNQFTSGETCRDIMKYISAIAYGFCEIGWDDKCYISTMNKDYDNIDEYRILTNDNYYSLKSKKNTYGPVNRVYVGLQDVQGEGIEDKDPSSELDRDITINIYNNPLTFGTSLEITDRLRHEVIEGANIVYGIQYRPFETRTPGHPWLKANMPICVYDMENNPIITYPLVNVLEYRGHIYSDLSSDAKTEIQDTIGYDKSVVTIIRDIGINVDKQNGIIQIINQQYKDVSGEIEDLRGQIIEIGDTYTKQEIKDIVNGIGVDGVVVTSVETATTIFDINGMTIGRTDSATKTNINSNGMKIQNALDNNSDLLVINNNGVWGENLTSRTYLNFGSHGRFEKYQEYNGGPDRIGCFWLEGNEE